MFDAPQRECITSASPPYRQFVSKWGRLGATLNGTNGATLLSEWLYSLDKARSAGSTFGPACRR